MFDDERKLAALAGQTGTPAYLFSERLFAERAALVKEAFGPDVDICYSIKANPFLLSFLSEVFARVEVCSPGELRICKKFGVAPEKIIFSGVNKQYEDIEAAVEYDCAVLTAESRQHLTNIERCAGEHQKTVDVLLRLARGAYLPGLMEDDILIFHETGAYSVSEGMAAFLSRDLPSVWLLYADGRLLRVRERTETYLWNCVN